MSVPARSPGGRAVPGRVSRSGGARNPRAPVPDPQGGFTLIELMIVTVLLGILAAIAFNLMGGAKERASLAAVQASARQVYIGFEQFYLDNQMYPNADNDPHFEEDTFDPLVSGGYYEGNIQQFLKDGRADDYDSPDDRGTNQEFWVTMTPEIEGDYRVVVANSDNVPLDPGTYYNGVQLFKDGEPVE